MDDDRLTMLKRIVRGLKVVFRELKEGEHYPKRREDLWMLKRLIEGFIPEIQALKEEKRRLLVAIAFNKHIRPYWEVRETWVKQHTLAVRAVYTVTTSAIVKSGNMTARGSRKSAMAWTQSHEQRDARLGLG